MPARKQRKSPARVKKIIAELTVAHPDARLALDFSTPHELLIALILAAQCTDAKVNEITRSLFRTFRRAEDYASADLATLEEAIRSTGFYRQKARTLQTCNQQLAALHDGNVPTDLDSLLALPGVGRKTANILLGNAFGEPGIGVDTHVARLSVRLGLSNQTNPDKIEADLVAQVPKADQIRFCHLLQFHGRRVCAARRPDCPSCTISALCPHADKTPATPKKKPRSRWVGPRA